MRADSTNSAPVFFDSELIRSYRGIADRSCFALSPDCRTILIRGYGMGHDFEREDFRIILWHTDTGIAEERFLVPMKSPPNIGIFNYVYSVALSPDVHYCAAGLWGVGAISVWDLRRSLELHRFFSKPDIGSVYSIAFSPDGQLLAAGGAGGLAVLSSLTGHTLFWLEGCFLHFNQLSFSVDGRSILCGDNDYPLRQVSVSSGKVIARISGIPGIESVALSQDGGFALAGCSDGTVHLCDMKRGVELRSWRQDDRDQPTATVYVLAPPEDEEERIIQLSKYTSVAFSPDSRRALTASRGGMMRLWALHSAREICRYAHIGEGIDVVSFLPDGRRAIACCNDGAVLLWPLPV
jgi:WD40 repeat protein